MNENFCVAYLLTSDGRTVAGPVQGIYELVSDRGQMVVKFSVLEPMTVTGETDELTLAFYDSDGCLVTQPTNVRLAPGNSLHVTPLKEKI